MREERERSEGRDKREGIVSTVSTASIMSTVHLRVYTTCGVRACVAAGRTQGLASELTRTTSSRPPKPPPRSACTTCAAPTCCCELRASLRTASATSPCMLGVHCHHRHRH